MRLRALAAMAASTLLVPLVVVMSPSAAQASGCNSNAVGSWSNNCTVVEGSVNNLVIGLQNFIDAFEGCGQIQTDGSFGPITLTAVKCMQGILGVTVDGSVGPITWGAMQSALVSAGTIGGWHYWGPDGGKDFRESTSTDAWDTWDPDQDGWVTM
jgi:peptidoglycan hydrolase-like protein with peptidoglycan-binding domain